MSFSEENMVVVVVVVQKVEMAILMKVFRWENMLVQCFY
jgi:hypothetical protein